MKLLFYCRNVVLVLSQIIMLATVVNAADFYVDPVNGNISNDGSQARPWSTLQQVFDACKIHTRAYQAPWLTTVPEKINDKCPSGVVEAGDTIYLMSGYQGSLAIGGALNTDYITVKAFPGETPTFKHIDLMGVAYWIFDGITVSPEFDENISVYANGIIQIEKHGDKGPSDHITIKNSTVYSVSDDLTSWPTLLDWFNGASRGIVAQGDYNTFENNTIRNTEGCIAINSSNFVTVTGNKCTFQSGDVFGISDSDDLLIEGNVLTDIIPSSEVYEDTHPDMMQFSSLNKNTFPEAAMYRVKVTGNYVHANLSYGIHPLVSTGPTQGIGMFDGMFIDSEVSNNIIVVNSTHSLCLVGARNTVVANNTVLYNPLVASYQWGSIEVYKTKVDWQTGQAYESFDNTVRNNIARSVTFSSSDTTSVKDNNILWLDTEIDVWSLFVDPENQDYSLKETATLAIGAGNSLLIPPTDYVGVLRADPPDIGAYEYVSGVVVPIPNGFVIMQ